VRRLLRETRGAVTAEWAMGAAVLVAVGAASLSGVQGSVVESLGSMVDAAAGRQAASQQQELEKKKQLHEEQERLERLQREAEEAREQSAWDYFSDWLGGDDDGADGWDPDSVRIQAERAWSGDDDD
jgi:hypothetical protein